MAKIYQKEEGNFNELMKLTDGQVRAFNRLKKAIERCKVERIEFGQVLNTLYAYNGNNICEYVVDVFGDQDCCIALCGDAGTTNYIRNLPFDSCADDSHYLVLTKEGKGIFLNG